MTHYHDRFGQTLATFAAPVSAITGTAAAAAYTFAIFGDMGITSAAHDTVNSMLNSVPPIEAVFHIGDLSYVRSNVLMIHSDES